MTPRGVIDRGIVGMETGKVKREPSGDAEVDRGVTLLKDLEGAHPLFGAVEARDIEVEPVGGDLLPEVVARAEGLSIKELIFLKSVDGFDIALPSIGFDGDVVMIGAQVANR